MRKDARTCTENRLVCWLIWWFHESHGEWPKRVIRVYSFREYFCASSHHVWVEEYNFWRTLYRALGMTFVWLKKLWDRGEAKLWPDKEKPQWPCAM